VCFTDSREANTGAMAIRTNTAGTRHAMALVAATVPWVIGVPGGV